MSKRVATFVFTLACLLTAVPAASQLNKMYFLYRGHNYLVDSRYQDAIETFNVLIKVDPKNHEAYFLRAIAKYNLDDLLGAESDFTTAVQLNPVYTMAYNYRAVTRARLGNYDDALRDFREAIALRPDLPGPYYSRGMTYFFTQQFDKAIDDFSEFIRQEPKVVDAYINRGTAHLLQKDTVRAYEDYNTAIRTNRNDPNGYYRRGALYMAQGDEERALADFNRAIACDTAFVPGYFSRAIVYANSHRPVPAIADLDKVIELDSTSSLAYFNRAIIRSQIGDFNRALEDYNAVARYSPKNVLLYFNRAALHTRLGDYAAAAQDYTRAIELHPDFSNAYLGRSGVRYMMNDQKGARQDRAAADRKIAEYRSKVADSTFSVYADTSRRFNQLLSFDTRISGGPAERISARGGEENLAMMPLFRFSFVAPDTVPRPVHLQYYSRRLDDFVRASGNPMLQLTTRQSDIAPDSLVRIESAMAARLTAGNDNSGILFERGIVQTLIKQYTNAVNTYTEAIEKDPSNTFLYLNRSATRSEMIDFISSIDNSYQRITVDKDPANRLQNASVRTYSYDEAIADLNKAAKLYPQLPYIYYNRANLQALSDRLPEAYEDYTRAIELYPNFAEAYFNRGLTQIFLKDTRKGLLDISKAGELGIREAYVILKKYDYRDKD